MKFVKKNVDRIGNLQQQLREQETECYDAINKTIKHVGSTGFGDSIITFLRPMHSNDKLESITDSSQELTALNNGVLFDVINNTYRGIKNRDFISQTMRIPFCEQVDENATKAI